MTKSAYEFKTNSTIFSLSKNNSFPNLKSKKTASPIRVAKPFLIVYRQKLI